jgi:hypothetical protein
VGQIKNVALDQYLSVDNKKGGSSVLQSLLVRLSYSYSPYAEQPKKAIDNSDSRNKIKMIHLLANHGAKWIPIERAEINEARRSLLKMSPDYTVEFIWIMSRYSACTRERIEDLIRTLTMRHLVSKHLPRIGELIEKLPTSGSS